MQAMEKEGKGQRVNYILKYVLIIFCMNEVN